jgi:hypothetical protein
VRAGALLASADLRVLLRHVVLGDLLVFEEILDAGQAAEPGTPSHDALRILAAWAAMQTARPDAAPQGEPNR